MLIYSVVYPVSYRTSLSIKDEGSVGLFVCYIVQRYETKTRTDQLRDGLKIEKSIAIF
jgi:hypothetical protein